MTINIRPVGEHEYERWLPLWQGYIEFYQASMPDENTAALWRRIHNPAHEIECRVAENTDTGALVGLVHYVEQTTTWNINPVCYLNDLFVIPGVRGGAVGEGHNQDLIDGDRRQVLGLRKEQLDNQVFEGECLPGPGAGLNDSVAIEGDSFEDFWFWK